MCHTHYHCCILDGVFEPRDDGSIRFLPAVTPTPQETAAIAEQVRRRVLRWFAHSDLLDADNARNMLGWDNAGFSLDGAMRVGGRERAGLSSVSERTGADLWILLVQRTHLSIRRQLEWGTGV